MSKLDDLIKNGGYTQYIDSYNGYYCYNDYKLTDTYKGYIANRNNNIITIDILFLYLLIFTTPILTKVYHLYLFL